MEFNKVVCVRFQGENSADHFDIRVMFTPANVANPQKGVFGVTINPRSQNSLAKKLYAVVEMFPCASPRKGALFAPGLARTGVFCGESLSTKLQTTATANSVLTVFICDEARSLDCVVEELSLPVKALISGNKVVITGERADIEVDFKAEAEQAKKFIQVSRARRLTKQRTGLFFVRLKLPSATVETG